MAVAANTVATMSDDEHRRQLRRALIASTVGTTIEWYDFLLYGTVSALVFGPIFFPQSAPTFFVQATGRRIRMICARFERPLSRATTSFSAAGRNVCATGPR